MLYLCHLQTALVISESLVLPSYWLIVEDHVTRSHYMTHLFVHFSAVSDLSSVLLYNVHNPAFIVFPIRILGL
jgi:hypothetical protein